MPQLSVIVPVYNESGNILPMAREIIAALNPTLPDFEVVFVDDASRDDTPERIAEAAREDARVRGIRLTENSGQSAAVWVGFQQTQSPLLATLDGDLQNDPADFPRMLDLMGEVDFVCGHRVNRKDTWVRRVSSKVARAVRQTVLRSDFADTGCALRVFKRECLAGLFGFNGMHRFLPILVAGGGFRTREIPVKHRDRTSGVSKYGVWNRLGRGIVDLFGVGWFQMRRTPRVAVTPIGGENPPPR